MRTEGEIEILYHNILHISEDSVNHYLQPLDSRFQAFKVIWQPLHYRLLQNIDCRKSKVKRNYMDARSLLDAGFKYSKKAERSTTDTYQDYSDNYLHPILSASMSRKSS